MGELEHSDVFSIDDVDASELDDLALLEHWRSSQSEEVVLVAVVDEVDGVLLGVDLGGLEDDVDIGRNDSVLDSLLLVGRLNKRGPPGDELDLVLGEELGSPVSQFHDSVALVFSESSVAVLLVPLHLVVGALHDVALVALVDDPVGEAGFEGDELSLVGQAEVEPSESDEVAHILGLWCLLDGVGVEVDGNELVELDVLVGDVGLEVEGWVDDLDLGDELFLVLKFEWLTNVDNHTECVNFISAVFSFGSVGLRLKDGLPE